MARNVSNVFGRGSERSSLDSFGWSGTIDELREAVFAVLYLLSKRRMQLPSNIGNTLLQNQTLKWAFPTLPVFNCVSFQELHEQRKAVCLNLVGQYLSPGTTSVPMDLSTLLDDRFIRFINREKQIPELMRSNLLILLAEQVSDVSPDFDLEEVSECFPAFSSRWRQAVDYLRSKSMKYRGVQTLAIEGGQD